MKTTTVNTTLMTMIMTSTHALMYAPERDPVPTEDEPIDTKPRNKKEKRMARIKEQSGNKNNRSIPSYLQSLTERV